MIMVRRHLIFLGRWATRMTLKFLEKKIISIEVERAVGGGDVDGFGRDCSLFDYQ